MLQPKFSDEPQLLVLERPCRGSWSSVAHQAALTAWLEKDQTIQQRPGMLRLKQHHWPNLVPFNATCVLGQWILVEFLHARSDVKWSSWRLRITRMRGQSVAMPPEAKGAWSGQSLPKQHLGRAQCCAST